MQVEITQQNANRSHLRRPFDIGMYFANSPETHFTGWIYVSYDSTGTVLQHIKVETGTTQCSDSMACIGVGSFLVNETTKSPLFNIGRSGFAVGVIDNKIYVFGGYENGHNVGLKSTEMLDLSTFEWHPLADNDNNNGYGMGSASGATMDRLVTDQASNTERY
jgi:hypothetical protein